MTNAQMTRMLLFYMKHISARMEYKNYDFTYLQREADDILKELGKAPDEHEYPTCRACNNVQKILSYSGYCCKVRKYGVKPDERRSTLCMDFEPLDEGPENLTDQILGKKLRRVTAERDKLDTLLHETCALRNDAEAQVEATNEWAAKAEEERDAAIDRAEKAEEKLKAAEIALDESLEHRTVLHKVRDEALARAEKAERKRDKLEHQLSAAIVRANDAEAQIGTTNEWAEKVRRIDDEFNQAFARTEKAEGERSAAHLEREKALARAKTAEKKLERIASVVDA